MRIRVRHATTYTYDQPASGVIQALRVSPAEHEGQEVLSWRIDVDVDGLLRPMRDAFGNVLHLFYAEGPVSQLTVRVAGEAAERGGVVAVLVREEDGVDPVPAGARRGQQLAELARRETRVDEHAGVVGFEERGVAGAATAQDAETQGHGRD